MKILIKPEYSFTAAAEERLFGTSERTCAASVYTTTQSLNRPRKVLTRRRLASCQRETSKLLALNVSVAWHSIPAQFHW